MKLKFVLLILAVVVCRLPVRAAEIPVLLRVPLDKQHDSTGCNFVTEVTRLVYSLIMENQVKLWDSRLKDIQITGTTLAELEKTSKTDFTKPEVLYLYENWEKLGSGIKSHTLGIMFLNKNTLGEEVSYGYVDYNDLNNKFIRHKVDANPNANNDLSLAFVLLKKQFYFNVVQFGGQTITTGAESRTILDDFVGTAVFNPTVRLPETEVRDITYVVDWIKNPGDGLSTKSNALLREIENFLQANEELFFNLGGDGQVSYLNRKKKIRISQLVVFEQWKKKNDVITTETDSIVIFTGDSALHPVRFSDFIMWGAFLDDQSMFEVFKEKQFTFFISRINSTQIARKDSYAYYKSLMNGNWRTLTESVKKL